MPSQTPRVFISYSHDSPEHKKRVLTLANQLRTDGIESWIDEYVQDPDEGWIRWMRNQVKQASRVLLVFTKTYQRRFEGDEEEGKGLGATFEGVIVTQWLYESGGRNAKFRPIVCELADDRFISDELRRFNHYRVDTPEGYENLLRWLHEAPVIVVPRIGRKPNLPPEAFPDTITDDKKPIHNLPFLSNPLFTGRQVELQVLRRALQESGSMAVTQTVTVHGLGGVGKTQLAVQYAWKYLREFDAVLWARADSPEALDASLAGLASVLRLPEANEHEQAVQIKAVLGWLAGHNRWLMIADNAAAARAVQEYLLPCLPGAMLITSRLSRWPLNMPHLPLDLFSAEEAVHYLMTRVTEHQHEAVNEAHARKLAEELGYLPLALEQAASFLTKVSCSFEQYREYLRDARPKLLSYEAKGATRYPASIAKTWSLTLERLNPLSRAVLRLAAWLAPEAIPRGLFTAEEVLLSEMLGGSMDVSRLSVDLVLAELDEFSLVRLASKTVSVHRLLQAVEQDSLSAEDCERWLDRAARLFNAFAPGSPSDARTWDVWLSLVPHAEALLEHTKRRAIDALPIALMANQFGLFLLARAAYAQAEPMFRRALAIREKAFGPEHPDVAQSLNSLATFYGGRGQYGKAEPLHQRALAIREKALGPEHPDVAQSLNDLAALYCDQGQYGKAEPLYQRALAIREKALGPEHPDVAQSLRNLATLYHNQGEYGRAEPRAIREGKGFLPARPGDTRKGAWPGAPQCGAEPRRPGGGLLWPGAIREGRATLPARPGDLRKGAGLGAHQCDTEPQQLSGALLWPRAIREGKGFLPARPGDPRKGARCGGPRRGDER